MRFPRAALLLILLGSMLGVVVWALQPMSMTDASEHVEQRRQEIASPASELAAPVLESARTGKSRLELEVKKREDFEALDDDDEEEWLKIRVVDDRGVPIQDALSYYEYIESPTDENGEVEIYLPMESETFWVTARGYEVLAVPSPAQRDRTLEITLLDSTMLHVKWLVPEHLDLGSLRVRFASDDLVFLADEFGRTDVSTKLRAALGMEATDIGTGWSNAAMEFCTIYPGDTGMEIWGLMPGVEMEVSLVNGDGQSVSNVYSGQWIEGEEQEILLVISDTLKSLTLLILDEEGSPLKRVAVEYRYRDVDGFDNSRSVGPDGRTTIDGIPGKTIDLLVRPTGFYASVYLDDVMIPNADEVLKIVIRKARKVSVLLETPTGDFLSGAGKADDGVAEVKRLKGPPPSLYMEAAPQHAFGFHWTAGGRSGNVTIPAGVAEYVIAVPAMGSLSVHATRENLEGNYLYIATFEGDHGDSYPHGIFFGFPKDGFETQREIASLQAGWHQVQLERMDRKTGKREFLLDYGRVEVKAGESIKLELKF